MIDIIKSSRIPVATIIQGKAMSSAAVLFTAGHEGYRFIGPHATLMIHDVSAWEPRAKAEEKIVSARETDRLNKKLYQIIDQNCGHKSGYSWDIVQSRARTDWYMSPKIAVQHNYANHIGIPVLSTEIKVEMKFSI